MEIGHNVMHGQYDWMNDPALSGKGFEWDNACPADQWRHSHNYMHHTHTNIVGKDRDIGYGVLRMSEDQRWRPYYLGNPALRDPAGAASSSTGSPCTTSKSSASTTGEAKLADKRKLLGGIWRKVRRQTLKDYVIFPALSGPFFLFPLAGNATANLVRNVWSFTIIFCGHFPEGTHEFTEEETENESRGEWYYRQLLGSANLSGSRPFHILSGNLSFQIEHHLFPDLPANRYARNLDRGPRDLRALRHPLQRRPAGQAVRQRRQEDLPPGAPRPKGPRRRSAACRGAPRRGGSGTGCCLGPGRSLRSIVLSEPSGRGRSQAAPR